MKRSLCRSRREFHSTALAPWQDRSPEIVLPVLEVGEVSGTLESASRRLAEAFGQAAGVDRRFKHAVFDPWPVILLLSGLCVGAVKREA